MVRYIFLEIVFSSMYCTHGTWNKAQKTHEIFAGFFSMKAHDNMLKKLFNSTSSIFLALAHVI